jgi:hypothetical protein
MPEWTFTTYTHLMANAYFSTTTKKHLWESFSEEMRINAVAEAERDVWAYLGGWCPLQHPDDILTDQRVRQDYAIYEQALYLCQISGAIPNGEETTPKWMANNPDSDAESNFDEEVYPIKICQRAKFWLNKLSYNPRIGRG